MSKINFINKIRKKNLRVSYSSPCFYCGVDSEQMKWFLLIVIGGLVLASLSIFLYAWIRGHFNNTETMAGYSINCEEDT
jgi:hypothetical protein